jgi:endonuclease IV
MLQYGVHVAKTSKVIADKKNRPFITAIQNDTTELNISVVQIHTHGPRGRTKNNMSYEKIKAYSKAHNLTVVSHSSYPSVSIWKVDKKNQHDDDSKKRIEHVCDQTKSCKKMDALGVVLHLSKRTPEQMAETFEVAHKHFKSHIFLETPATKPNPSMPNITYETPEKLTNLNNALKKFDNWSICVDTAHIWSAGIDISDKKILDAWLKKLPNNVGLFHINGSNRSTFNKGRDVHIIPFSKEDDIWNKCITDYSNVTKNIKAIKESGFYSILLYCKKYKVPIVFEINRGSPDEVTFLMQIMHELKI